MSDQGPPDPSARATTTNSTPTPVTAGVAASLARSPLGIIALFIVLVDSIACISVFAMSGAAEALPLIWFIIVFPFVVFFTFIFLVVKYPNHLYGPQDFTDQRLFLLMLLGKVSQANESSEKLASELSDVGLPKNMNPSAQLSEIRVQIQQALGMPSEQPGAIPTLLPVPPKRAEIVPPSFGVNRTSTGATGQDVNAADPNKGRFGGKRENASWKVEVVDNRVRSFGDDLNLFRLQLRVTAQKSGTIPTGAVIFHLHPTFPEPMERVSLTNGVAELAMITYGSFTAGIELPDGTQLEIDLADADINSPKSFKDR